MVLPVEAFCAKAGVHNKASSAAARGQFRLKSKKEFVI
jgi:hypothetical protein